MTLTLTHVAAPGVSSRTTVKLSGVDDSYGVVRNTVDLVIFATSSFLEQIWGQIREFKNPAKINITIALPMIEIDNSQFFWLRDSPKITNSRKSEHMIFFRSTVRFCMFFSARKRTVRQAAFLIRSKGYIPIRHCPNHRRQFTLSYHLMRAVFNT